MRKWFTLAVIFLFSAAALLHAENYSQPAAGETVSHFHFFRDHFPRHDGSENEKKVFEYIETKLSEYGIDYSSSDFSGFTDGHSFSKNIDVIIPGSGRDTLLLVVPVNHPVNEDAEAASWNLAAGLGYLLYSKERADREGPPPMGIRVLFAGGEFVPDSGRQFGSELFLESYYPDENVAVMYFMLRGIPGTLVLKNGNDKFFSPYWILNRLAESLEEEKISCKLELEYTQLYRLGISGRSSRISDYLLLELPAVEVSSEPPAKTISPAKRNTRIETFFAGLDRFAGKNGGVLPSGWDRHYIFIRFGDNNLLVTESVYIPLLLGLFTAVILFVLFFRRRMGKYRKVLFRKFWVLIVLFALIFLFLFIGTYVIKGISATRDFSGIWRERPLLFFFLKLSAALSFFFFLFRFVKQFPFPVIRSFYSASAILLFFLLMAVVSIFNISLTYYFAWAFLWTVLFSIFQNRFAKLFSSVAAAFSLFFGLYELFHLDAFEAIRFILLSPIYGNLFFSLLLLPFILMIIRTAIAFHDAGLRELHIHGWVLYAFPVAAFAALMVYGFLFQPFSPVNPREISVEEIINYELEERKLVTVSNAPLRTVNIEGGGYEDIRAGSAQTIVQYTENIPDLLDISFQKEEFLDRKYYTITLAAEGTPVRISMKLHSNDRMVIYDSNFPFRTASNENKGEIYIGAFPPNPLKIEVVLPQDIEVEARFTVFYLQPPYDLSFTSENAVIQSRMSCISWVDL